MPRWAPTRCWEITNHVFATCVTCTLCKKRNEKVSCNANCILWSNFFHIFLPWNESVALLRRRKSCYYHKNSIACIDANVPVMIFPEDSSTGYHEKLKSFFPGFVGIAERYRKLHNGEDVNIYPIYYHKEKQNGYRQACKTFRLRRNGQIPWLPTLFAKSQRFVWKVRKRYCGKQHEFVNLRKNCLLQGSFFV